MDAISREMEAIIKKRGYPDEIPKFENKKDLEYNGSYVGEELICQENVQNLELYYELSEYPADFGKGIKGYVKKIVVKLVRFYFLPVVEKQNLFNRSSKECSKQLLSLIMKQKQQIEILEVQIQKMSKIIDELETEEK